MRIIVAILPLSQWKTSSFLQKHCNSKKRFYCIVNFDALKVVLFLHTIAMKIIENNPFRILGVYTNATTGEITARVSEINDSLKEQNPIKFDSDMDGLFHPVKRDEEILAQAQASISQPLDKLKYALFWFCNMSPEDEKELKYIQEGEYYKSEMQFELREDAFFYINRGVLSLAVGDYEKGIPYLLAVICNSAFRDSFVKAICGDDFLIAESDLAHLFIDAMVENLPPSRIKTLFKERNDSFRGRYYGYFKQQAIGNDIAIVKKAISKAESAINARGCDRLAVGVELMSETKEPLEKLHSILMYDERYASVANRVAKIIVVCVKDDSTQRRDIKEELLYYAKKIAQDQLLEDEIKRVCIDVVSTKFDTLVEISGKDEYGKLVEKIEKAGPSIKYAREIKPLLKDCQTLLEKIKNSSSYSDEKHLEISSFVVSEILDLCEEFASEEIRDYNRHFATNFRKDCIITVFADLSEVYKMMMPMEMSMAVKVRFLDARSKFIYQKNQVNGISKHSIPLRYILFCFICVAVSYIFSISRSLKLIFSVLLIMLVISRLRRKFIKENP